jgi:hypothetical protein
MRAGVRLAFALASDAAGDHVEAGLVGNDPSDLLVARSSSPVPPRLRLSGSVATPGEGESERAREACWRLLLALSGHAALRHWGRPGPTNPAAAAKTCSAGYTHAVIGGAQKCLRRGEYCTVADKRQYPKYGYICEDVNGSYRLEPKV